MKRAIALLALLCAFVALLVSTTAPVFAQTPDAPPSAQPSSPPPGASSHPPGGHQHSTSTTEDLVPLLVPMSFFGSVVFIVAFALFYRYRKDAGRLDVARSLAEGGKQIPEGLLEAAPKGPPISDLKKGFVLVVTGLGISAAAHFGGAREAIGIGFIPGFIGLAYLAVWRIQRGGADSRAES